MRRKKDRASFLASRALFRFVAAECFRPEPVQRAENGLGAGSFIQDEHTSVAGGGLDGVYAFLFQEPAFDAVSLVMIECAAAAAYTEPAGRMMDNLVMHG